MYSDSFRKLIVLTFLVLIIILMILFLFLFYINYIQMDGEDVVLNNTGKAFLIDEQDEKFIVDKFSASAIHIGGENFLGGINTVSLNLVDTEQSQYSLIRGDEKVLSVKMVGNVEEGIATILINVKKEHFVDENDLSLNLSFFVLRTFYSFDSGGSLPGGSKIDETIIETLEDYFEKNGKYPISLTSL